MRLPDAPPTDLKPLMWLVRGRALSTERALIMGVVNVTPDSFSDGGRYFDQSAALAHARRLIEEGADILDIGGESTRPGADAVDVQEEIRRVVPLIEALEDCGVPLSIDTSKPEVMRAALRARASIVNDVCAFRTQGALDVVADSDCGIVLMHMQGTPRTMQIAPSYGNVTQEVVDFLAERVEATSARGIDRQRIAVDPGFGFGKTADHNYTLLRELSALQRLQRPLLVGLSRKGMLRAVTGRAIEERGVASVAAALLAVERGASIVRVHDVPSTRDALNVLYTVQGSG